MNLYATDKEYKERFDYFLEEVKNDFNVIVSSIKEQPQFLNVLTLPKLDKEEFVLMKKFLKKL